MTRARIIREQMILLGSDLRRFRHQPYAAQTRAIIDAFSSLPDEALYHMGERLIRLGEKLEAEDR